MKCLNRRDVGADCHYNLVMARHCVGTFLTVLVRGPRSLLAETKLDMLRPILVQDCLHFPLCHSCCVPLIFHTVTQSPRYTFVNNNPTTFALLIFTTQSPNALTPEIESRILNNKQHLKNKNKKEMLTKNNTHSTYTRAFTQPVDTPPYTGAMQACELHPGLMLRPPGHRKGGPRQQGGVADVTDVAWVDGWIAG